MPTTVLPVPVIVPTDLIRAGDIQPAGRGGLAVVDDIHGFASTEVEPASSSVAPLATVAVTPLPMVGEPDASLNRNVPLLTSRVLSLPRHGATLDSNMPCRCCRP